MKDVDDTDTQNYTGLIHEYVKTCHLMFKGVDHMQRLFQAVSSVVDSYRIHSHELVIPSQLCPIYVAHGKVSCNENRSVSHGLSLTKAFGAHRAVKRYP